MTSPDIISDVGYTIEPKTTMAFIELGPFLGTLPQELRDIIFADCLASGHPQFMASSRAMRMEGMSQIFEKGVYRMNFGIMVRMNLPSKMPKGAPECLQPPREIAEKIQHLCIRVHGTVRHLDEFWSTIDLDTIKLFGGSEIRRKSCKVLLEVRYDRGNNIGDEVFHALQTLVGFEKVELRMVFPTSDLPIDFSQAQKNLVSVGILQGYRSCAAFLRPTLGRVSHEWDGDGPFLRFNPPQG